MTQTRSRREQRYQQAQSRSRRRVWGSIAVGIVVGVGIVVVVLAVGGGGAGSTVAQLSLDEYTITGDLEVPAGEVELAALNVGAIPHNVGLKGGPITTNLRPGAQGTVKLGDLSPGTYQLFCDISDHEARGMVATFTVTEPTAADE